MCGISAVWGEHSPGLAEAIAEHLGHRGPDDRGVSHQDGLSLAHRRLAIIDPSGGRQPLADPQEQGSLVANGMIYNDKALRSALSDARFRTSSDSESILHNSLRHGSGAVADLDGMFAYVMAHGDKLVAARDPIGIKPLYVGRRGRTFCFASEIKALAPYVDSIVEFPPGHVFDSTKGLQPYYTLPAAADDLSDPEAARQAIRETLTRSIEKRLRSDVPLGVFLSGGLDSSIIAAVACQFRSSLKSFSVGLEGSPDLLAARRVADHLGTEHHEYVLSVEEIVRDLPTILYHLESFDRDLVRSAVPCYYVSRLAAEHVKVVLTGEGADELFAGYDYHKSYQNPHALQAELRRSVSTMHDINLQRVDRMTMAHGLEARVPFLDRDMLDLAFRIPATLKLPATSRTEKWILRKAFEDLLPAEIVWRDKAQFDQGSGMSDMLERHAANAPAPELHNELPRPARSREEALYRDLLIGQFERPDRLLPLVAHWDDERRIEDTVAPTSPSVGRIGHAASHSAAGGNRTLESFDALYDRPSPRRYFKRMSELDYRIPHAASPIIRWCIDELRRVKSTAELTVLDLCAGYGINGALMQLDMSLFELYDYFSEQERDHDDAFFDRLYLDHQTVDQNLKVIGQDIASRALEYGHNAGFFSGTHAVNLESEPVTPQLRADLSDCALITVTGGFSFIGATTFDRILSALPADLAKPWIAGFPTQHCDLEPVLEVLYKHGYVVQADIEDRFRQRRFANDQERDRERAALTQANLTTQEKTYFEARLLLAQPEGMPTLPRAILKRAAAANLEQADAWRSAVNY